MLVGDYDSETLVSEESPFDWGGRLLKSNGGVHKVFSVGIEILCESVKAQGCLTVRLTSRTDAKAGLSDPAVLSDHIDGNVWHLDVGSSHPGGAEPTKGWAVRPLKRSALSTQGPEWTDQGCSSCHVSGTAGVRYLRDQEVDGWQ
ncbi:33621_t:CDS:2, partial [Racocetra persica]